MGALVYTKGVFCYILNEFVGAGKIQLACTCAGLEAGERGNGLAEMGLKVRNRFHFALVKLKKGWGRKRIPQAREGF
jgi:hypothetical protein